MTGSAGDPVSICNKFLDQMELLNIPVCLAFDHQGPKFAAKGPISSVFGLSSLLKNYLQKNLPGDL